MTRFNISEGDSSLWKLRLIGTVLSIVLLIWLLTRQDWNAILSAVGELSWWQVFLSILLIMIRHVFNSWRWLILLRAQQIMVPFREALKLVFAGLFVSNFLPSMVGGDVVRIAAIVNRTENRVAGAASVVVDRLIGALGMLVALPFGFPLISSLFGLEIEAMGVVGSLGSRLSGFIRSSMERLGKALKIWAKQPERLFLAMLANWAGMFVNFIAIWILAIGLKMGVSLGEVVGISALTYYLTIIPLSINGYGIRELAIVGLYTQLGTTAEQASALALLSRSVFLFVSLFGAIWAGKLIQARSDQSLTPLEDEIG